MNKDEKWTERDYSDDKQMEKDSKRETDTERDREMIEREKIERGGDSERKREG